MNTNGKMGRNLLLSALIIFLCQGPILACKRKDAETDKTSGQGDNKKPTTVSLKPVFTPDDPNFTNVTCLAFSPDSKLFAAATINDNQVVIKLCDSSSGEVIHSLAYGSNDAVSTIEFASDGSMVAAGDFWGRIKLWAPATGEPIEFHSLPLGQDRSPHPPFKFLPDKKILATRESDPQDKITSWISIWDPASGERIKSFTVEQGMVATDISISPDGKYLAARLESEDVAGSVTIWNIETAETVRSIDMDRNHWGMIFSPDWKKIAAFENRGNRPGDGSPLSWIYIYDVASGEQVSMIEGPEELSRVLFSPDGKSLAATSLDYKCTISVLDTLAAKPITSFVSNCDMGPATGAIAYSPNGQFIAAINSDDHLKILDPVSGIMISDLEISGISLRANNQMVFSPNGKLLALNPISYPGYITKFWSVSEE